MRISGYYACKLCYRQERRNLTRCSSLLRQNLERNYDQLLPLHNRSQPLWRIDIGKQLATSLLVVSKGLRSVISATIFQNSYLFRLDCTSIAQSGLRNNAHLSQSTYSWHRDDQLHRLLLRYFHTRCCSRCSRVSWKNSCKRLPRSIDSVNLRISLCLWEILRCIQVKIAAFQDSVRRNQSHF